MSKFNAASKKGSTETVNHEGALAFTLQADTELYAAVATTFLSDKFYEQADERISRIRLLIVQNDPVFVAKLAIYAREQMNLRAAPILLTVLLMKSHHGDDLVRKVIRRVVKRADEITELLGCYKTMNQKEKLSGLSKQMMLGLKDVLNNFDEYQFAKYNRNKEITLRDALFLIHPSPHRPENQALFDKIAKNELKTPETWEVKISASGKELATEEEKSAAKKAEWERLIKEGKLGYMALLRNLRNFLESNIGEEFLQIVIQKLTDKEEVRKSKQFPFRFLAAYHEISEVQSIQSAMIMDALEEATMAACQHISGFDNTMDIFIAADVSGSMNGTISPHSKITLREVGLILAMMLRHRCKGVAVCAFSDNVQMVNVPKTNILANSDKISSITGVGGGTNGFKVMELLFKSRFPLDKVMIFTDCEMWDNEQNGGGQLFRDEWINYKKFCPKAKLYLFDLAGYGKTPISIHQQDCYAIAGWNEKVFDILDSLDRGEDAVAEIKKIEL